ncbi:MAG TPA: VOC family protein [Asanoa sp.]|nr:VOC family protein [Asanoa sp.]
MSGNMTVRLGSVVLGSPDPQRLARWYRTAFAPDAPDGVVLELGAGSRLIFDARTDVAPAPREPGRVLINLYVADAHAVAAHLTGLGVRWVRPLEPFPPGLIGTVEDADGNYVQVVQLGGPA